MASGAAATKLVPDGRRVRDPATDKAHKPIADQVFGSLAYGPAPEDGTSARMWLKARDVGPKAEPKKAPEPKKGGDKAEGGKAEAASSTAAAAAAAASSSSSSAAPRLGHFINNEWHMPSGGSKAPAFRASTCPADGEVLCETLDGSNADVDTAVAAAKAAQPGWAALSGHERAKYLYAIARHLQQHHRLMACMESLDNGKSIRETRDFDVPTAIRHLYHYAGWAQIAETEYSDWTALGVIGAIVPWNFPLMLLVWKVAPALAMGNTVVLKPASYTRLSALLFAEICAEAGLPAGVLNVVTGSGAMGSHLADHPDVAKVAFTGSTPVGRLLRERIAGSGKKISLELGGKSPVVVYDNADLDAAVEGVIDAVFFNQGQVCSAGSRLLVHEAVADKLLEKLYRRVDTFRIGHPLDKGVDMGALVDKSQYDTIEGFVSRARAEGATVYVSSASVPDKGYFWPPTIISDVHPVSEVVREEIFGPVLAVQRFRSPKEAVALANNTFFGLAGSVWTENASLALETALSIKAGTVWVNGHNLFDAAAGFGGYRESGFGRDGGREGLFEYMKPAWKKQAMADFKSELTFPTTAAKWPAPVMPGPNLPAPAAGAGAAAAGGAAGVLKVDKTHKMYIGGVQKRPDQVHSRTVRAPDGTTLGLVGEGNRKDIRDACEAAAAAAPGWGKRAAHNRAQICYYIAENLQERLDEFASRISKQTGCTEAEGAAEVNKSIERLFYYAAYADKFGGYVSETQLYGATVSVHEPIGVVAVACPDACPLLGFVSLIAPLIVRGNAVVVLPSPTSPLSAVDLFEVFETSDLPAGVVNIVTGDREALSRTLAEHDDVDSFWYFGTQQGSANVEFASSKNMKRSFVDYGVARDWMNNTQGQGEEFLREAIECKSIWMPMGDQ